MPLIRCTYPRAVQMFGSEPVSVSDVEARTLIEKRWAVEVTEDELAELKKPQLVEVAEDLGVPTKGTKADIVEAITKPKAE